MGLLFENFRLQIPCSSGCISGETQLLTFDKPNKRLCLSFSLVFFSFLCFYFCGFPRALENEVKKIFSLLLFLA